MSSIQGAVPKGAAPRGVTPKKSSVVKQLPADQREILAKSAPVALLQAVAQPFHGMPSPVFMTTDEKKDADEEQANPLLHPDQTQLKKKKKNGTSGRRNRQCRQVIIRHKY